MDLALSNTVKCLTLALLGFILFKSELRLKFQDKKDYLSAIKRLIYILFVQKFFCMLILLVHISSSLLAQVSKLETAKHQNS